MNDWSFKEIFKRQHDRFTPTQAFRLTGISVTTIRTWIEKGYLKTIKKPGGEDTFLFTGMSLIHARDESARSWRKP